jgi:putative DNA primase/helicase
MKPSWSVLVDVPVNGRFRKGVVKALCDGDLKFTDKANLEEAKERRRVAKALEDLTAIKTRDMEKLLLAGWLKAVQRRQEALAQQRAAAEEAESGEDAASGGCPWRGVNLPAGYRITPAGCVEDLGEDDPRLLARGPVWVEAFARDHRFDGWGSLLVWRDRDGQTHRGAFPAGRFHEQSLSLVQELAGGGLAVVPGQERGLLRYLAAFNTERRVRSVNRLGWVDVPDVPVPVYVFSGAVMGNTSDEEFVYQPDVQSVLVSAPREAGTLEEWQAKVARRARKNPVLVFSLAVSFAGPLLKFAGVEGGGFHLYGASSKGKTTDVQLAASVWGSGADPAEAPGTAYVKKWNATANAVEAIAAEHNDGLLVLDEIGEAQVHDFSRLVYQLAGGQGKSRLTRDAALRSPRRWRVFVLSTGEVPVEAFIESAGRGKAKGGQLVRMVDIPATSGSGSGIVCDAHGLLPAEFVHRLKRACATYYGTAGPAFVRALCQEGDVARLGKTISQELDKAHQLLTPAGAAAEVSRVVRRFALVLVAGRRACAAGVLPFSPCEVESAIRLVLRRWLDVHGHGAMERAVEQLRAFLLRNEARFRDRKNTDHVFRDLAGYRDRDRGLFLLTPEGAKEALEGHALRDVMRHLQKKKLLFVNETDRLLSGHQICGVDRMVRLYAVRAEILGPKEEVGRREEEDDDEDTPPAPGAETKPRRHRTERQKRAERLARVRALAERAEYEPGQNG